jgi:hypothetical protein
VAALAAWALANEARAACSQAGLVVASTTAAESSVADRGGAGLLAVTPSPPPFAYQASRLGWSRWVSDRYSRWDLT